MLPASDSIRRMCSLQRVWNYCNLYMSHVKWSSWPLLIVICSSFCNLLIAKGNFRCTRLVRRKAALSFPTGRSRSTSPLCFTECWSPWWWCSPYATYPSRRVSSGDTGARATTARRTSALCWQCRPSSSLTWIPAWIRCCTPFCRATFARVCASCCAARAPGTVAGLWRWCAPAAITRIATRTAWAPIYRTARSSDWAPSRTLHAPRRPSRGGAFTAGTPNKLRRFSTRRQKEDS